MSAAVPLICMTFECSYCNDSQSSLYKPFLIETLKLEKGVLHYYYQAITHFADFLTLLLFCLDYFSNCVDVWNHQLLEKLKALVRNEKQMMGKLRLCEHAVTAFELIVICSVWHHQMLEMHMEMVVRVHSGTWPQMIMIKFLCSYM